MGVTHAGTTDSAATSDRANTGTRSGATGTTTGSASGSVAGQSAPAGPSEKEQQRGNTPPGVSRDGQGPAAGAIVDPAGVTKK
jgi:hypothetical protein